MRLILNVVGVEYYNCLEESDKLLAKLNK